MKKMMFLAVVSMLSASAFAQTTDSNQNALPVAGGAVLSKVVTENELGFIAEGYSAKKSILGHAVYNDKKEKVGTVSDVIVTKDKSISYGILDVGGFLGVGKKHVAVPVSLFKMENGQIVLADATKDELKAMPSFKYLQ